MKWSIEIELDDTGDLYDKPENMEKKILEILEDHFSIVSINAEPILEEN